jgi:hypothetical protein
VLRSSPVLRDQLPVKVAKHACSIVVVGLLASHGQDEVLARRLERGVVRPEPGRGHREPSIVVRRALVAGSVFSAVRSVQEGPAEATRQTIVYAVVVRKEIFLASHASVVEVVCWVGIAVEVS